MEGMKPGDLVHPHRFAIELYNEEILSEIWDTDRYANITFEPDEIGVILEMIPIKDESFVERDTMCKVLVPGGIGYTYERWMRVVEP